MSKYRSVLLYNLYPLNKWKEITDSLLAVVHHDDIIVHINIPKRNPIAAINAYRYVKKFEKLRGVYFSLNYKTKGESKGFETFRRVVDFDKYDIASYIHSKGSSRKRKDTEPIKSWTELLRYFVVERLDLAIQSFEQGYYLYGVNLSEQVLKKRDGSYISPGSNFLYQGNFVTINLNSLEKKFLITECKPHYYGLEMFWGCLCSVDKAFEVHNSQVDHYNEVYLGSNYK